MSVERKYDGEYCLDTADCRIKRLCILEGELLVWTDDDERIEPFHKIRKHVKRSGRLIGTARDSPVDWQDNAEKSWRIARQKRCIGFRGCEGSRSSSPCNDSDHALKQRLLGSAHQGSKAPDNRESLDPRIHQNGRWLQRFLNQKTQQPSDPN